MLLSGMRRTASCEAKRANLGEDCLHVPNPKGGSAKKFDLPLSSALSDLLAHRETNADDVRRKTPYLMNLLRPNKSGTTTTYGHGSDGSL